MRICILAVIFAFTVTGCKAKVYWLPGTLETNGVSTQCDGRPDISNTITLKEELNRLVAQSMSEEDPERLNSLAGKISVMVKKLESVLAPEFTKEQYPVTYRFRVNEDYIPEEGRLYFQDFSISGYRILGDGIRVKNMKGYKDIVLQRQATLLEICALKGTVQGLYSVGKREAPPKFYYRLFVESVK